MTPNSILVTATSVVVCSALWWAIHQDNTAAVPVSSVPAQQPIQTPPNSGNSHHTSDTSKVSTAVDSLRGQSPSLPCTEQVLQFQYSDEFVACIESLLAGTQHTRADLLPLYSAWLPLDAQASLDHALSLGPQYRSYLLSALLGELAALDSYSALDWLAWQTLPAALKADLTSVVYRRLAQLDPENTIAEVTQLEDSELKQSVIDQLLEAWAKQDAAAVIEWLDAKQQPQFYMDIKHVVLMAWVDQELDAAGEYIAALPASTLKEQSLSYFGHSLAKADIDAALSWLDSVDDQAVKQAAMVPIIEWAVTDSAYQQRVIDLVLSQPADDYRDGLIAGMATQLAANQLTAIVDIYPTIPLSSQPAVAGIIAQQWVSEDYVAAKDWVNTLPDSASADRAKRIVGENIVTKDWREAVSVANTISAYAERYRLLEHAIRYGMSVEPEAAAAVLDKQTDITEQDRAKLQRAIY